MTTQNPEVNSRPFFLSIPETVARNPNLSPAAKCVAGSIYTRTHQRNVRPGVFVLIRADWIAAEWSMSADAVTAGIKQLEEAGIVERNRTRAGNALRWSSYEDPENQESGKSGIRKKRNDIPEKAESRFRKKRNQESGKSGIQIPEKTECTLIPVPRPETRPETESARTAAAPAVPVQVQAAELEPHESVLATRLPEQDRDPELPETVRYLIDRISPAAMQWAWSKVAVQGVDPNDWRILETLRKVHGSGSGRTGSAISTRSSTNFPSSGRPRRRRWRTDPAAGTRHRNRSSRSN